MRQKVCATQELGMHVHQRETVSNLEKQVAGRTGTLESEQPIQKYSGACW